MKICSMPGCKFKAATSFATVPVCENHREELMEEAILFYKRKIDDRYSYEQIKHLTPFQPARVGLNHPVKIISMKNGRPTRYLIKGEEYIRDRKKAIKND